MSRATEEVDPTTSSVLRGLRSSAPDGDALHAELARALDRSGGALIEPRGAGSSEHTVTFVALGPSTAPAVRSPIFGTLDWQQDMQLLSGTSDVWWAEATTTHPDLRTTYRFLSRRVEPQEFQSGDDASDAAAHIAAAYELGYPDPFNPRCRYPSSAFGMGVELPREKWDSVLVLPRAEQSPWVDDPTEQGVLTRFPLWSGELGNQRQVTVWSPSSVSVEAALPLVILLDGEDLLYGVGAPALFDTLVREKVVAPFRAALVANPTITSRMSEYPCNPLFVNFVADELFPALCDRFSLAGGQTATVIGGFSYGGLASLWIGFSRPEIFGGIIASSPSMWWGPGVRLRMSADEVDGPTVDAEWLTRQYAEAERKPLRLWIDVGLLETQRLPFANGVDMLSSCRRFRDVLDVRGYDVVGYWEQPCGHEYLGWREALAQGLIALFGRS